MSNESERRDRIEGLSEALHDDIINLKKELKTTRVKPGAVYLADAAELCNIGVVANQVHNILIKQKIVDAQNQVNDLLEKYMPYMTIMVIAVCMLLAVLVVIDYLK